MRPVLQLDDSNFYHFSSLTVFLDENPLYLKLKCCEVTKTGVISNYYKLQKFGGNGFELVERK